MTNDAAVRHRSVHFAPPSQPHDSATAHSFLRDLGVSLGRLEDHLEVKLVDEGRGDEVAELLGREHRHDSLERVVAHFIERCAGRVAAYGEAWFEIARSHQGRPVLMSMPPYRFTSLGGIVLQHVPRAERTRIGRSFVKLPATSVVRFRLPASLGGPRRQRSLLKVLGRVGFGFPEFILREEQRNAFDLSAYSMIRDRHVARATKLWGWNEGLRSEHVATDFFNVHRRLRFARTRSTLVEHVIAELNALMDRYGLGATVTLAPDLRASAFEQATVDLREGRLSLLDAIKVGFR